MAILMLISELTERPGLQDIDDVVGYYRDGHEFSAGEQARYNFLTVKGSQEDVKLRFDQIKPTIRGCYLWESDDKYHWEKEEDGQPIFEYVSVYQVEGDKKWFVADEDFKYGVNVSGLTNQEKQRLIDRDVNDASVTPIIKRLVRDITKLPGNDVEIKELKDTSPYG